MFSQRLKELRIERGLTQQELSTKLNINRTTLAGYENTNKEPPYQTLVQISKFFNVTTDYLLGASPNKKQENSNIGEQLGLDDNSIDFLKEFSVVSSKALFNKIFNNLTLDSVFISLAHIERKIIEMDTFVENLCISYYEVAKIGNLQFDNDIDKLELSLYKIGVNFNNAIKNIVGYNSLLSKYEKFILETVEDIPVNTLLKGGEYNASDKETK